MSSIFTAVPGTMDYLATKNAHVRDKDITFEEGPHIYTVLGDRGGCTSVTTWNHRHFEQFDADGIINKMMKSKNWTNPSYKYYGMTRDQIKKMWDDNRDNAANAGTKMHNDIECYYNEMDVKNDSLEYTFFQNFVKDYGHLTPYRTEWMVYYEELKLSGSIDMIFENPDGTIQIYDWKRCKEINHDTEYGKFAKTSCISHLPDTNFWHYALQLNMYKTILEHKYDKKVTALYLVCMHPDNIYKNYQRIEVPILTKEMDELLKMRNQEVIEMENK